MIHSPLQSAVLTALVFSVFAMTAVIWVVQVIIYPLFTAVGEAQFLDYHNRDSIRISFIVIQLMGCQLVTALAAVVVFWNDGSRAFFIVGALLTLSTWLVTFIVQVPQHAKLGNGYDRSTAIKLVKGNQIRARLWSIHSILLIIQLLR